MAIHDSEGPDDPPFDYRKSGDKPALILAVIAVLSFLGFWLIGDVSAASAAVGAMIVVAAVGAGIWALANLR